MYVQTVEVQGALQKSRYQQETGPCLLLGAADVRRSTYGKGCNSKFYAFSGFMNPRLSAAMLCCPPTAPSPPIQNKNLEGLRMQWPGRVGITLSAWYSSERVPPASLSLVPPYPGRAPPSFFPFVSCSIFLLYRSIVRRCKSKWALRSSSLLPWQRRLSLLNLFMMRLSKQNLLPTINLWWTLEGHLRCHV